MPDKKETINDRHHFHCGVERGKLTNTIALQEMEIDNLKVEIEKLKSPKSLQFTDEYIWLQTWLKCTPEIDSYEAEKWAHIAITKYHKAFNDETTGQKPEVLADKKSS